MVSTKHIFATVAAAVTLVQMAPAPYAVLGIVRAVVTGVRVTKAICKGVDCTKKNSRSIQHMIRALPPGVPQFNIDLCTAQIKEQTKNGIMVLISNEDDTTINVDNVPPSCMVLATVISGSPAQSGGPIPFPTSSKSLKYINMKPEDRQNLVAALNAKA